MSAIEKFVEALKKDDVIGAFAIVKEECSNRARVVTEQTQMSVAESFKMTPIQEKEEEEEKSENEEENKEETDEEKEKKKADEAAGKGE